MTVKELIKQLKEIENKNKFIHFLGNETNGEDENLDILFNSLEIWDDSTISITLFMCNQ